MPVKRIKHMNYVLIHRGWDDKMRTCWVFDHPAHVRLLAPFVRTGETSDIIIACDRIEVRKLLDAGDGILPRRQTVFVPRPVGKRRYRKAIQRLSIVKRALRGKGIERIISVGAPLEHRVAKRLGITKRIYVSDTEINHLAHKLCKNFVTDVIIPTHWDSNLDGDVLESWRNLDVKIHRLDGLHGHVHLRPQLRPVEVSDPPKILIRRLRGNGVHDNGEVIPIPSEILVDLDVIEAHEDEYDQNPWELDKVMSSCDGVITQSVTLASEAVILNVPTLLISKAERGFLDRLASNGYPLFRWRGDLEKKDEITSQFFAGLALTEFIESEEWPDAKTQFENFISFD